MLAAGCGTWSLNMFWVVTCAPLLLFIVAIKPEWQTPAQWEMSFLPGERESFGQPRHRWRDDIKMHPEITGSKICSGFDRLRIGVYGHGLETVGPIKPWHFISVCLFTFERRDLLLERFLCRLDRLRELGRILIKFCKLYVTADHLKFPLCAFRQPE